MDPCPYLDEFYCVIKDNQQLSQIYDKFALPIRHKNFFKQIRREWVVTTFLNFFHNRSYHKLIIVLVGHNSSLSNVEFMLHRNFFFEKQLLFSNVKHFLWDSAFECNCVYMWSLCLCFKIYWWFFWLQVATFKTRPWKISNSSEKRESESSHVWFQA